MGIYDSIIYSIFLNIMRKEKPRFVLNGKNF
jgi:hypothetical protein